MILTVSPPCSPTSDVTIHTGVSALESQAAAGAAIALKAGEILVNGVALAALLLVADIGTRDAGITGFRYDPKTGIVHTVIEKIEVKKDEVKENEKPDPRVFCAKIMQTLEGEQCKDAQVIINMTSSSRAAQDSSLPADKNPDKALLEAIKGMANERIVVNVLTQPEEAIISAISLAHVITHSKFCQKNNITVENTIQVEGGNGSIQSAAILPQQSVEMAGKWATAELDSGKSLAEVITTLKGIIKNEKHLMPEIPGIKNIGVQGSLAVGLSLDKGAKINAADKVLAAALGTDYVNLAKSESLKDWDQGRKLVPISRMIAALKSKINHYQSEVTKASKQLLSDKATELRAAMFVGEVKIEESDMVHYLKAYAFEVKNKFPKLDTPEAELLKPFFKAWDEMKSNAVPTVLALATLEAIKEKYKTEFNCFVLKDYTLLQTKTGEDTTFKAKVSGSHGAAVQYFLKTHPIVSRMGKVSPVFVRMAEILSRANFKSKLVSENVLSVQ